MPTFDADFLSLDRQTTKGRAILALRDCVDALVSGGGDDLGNHTATQALAMSGFGITGVPTLANAGNMQIRPDSSPGLGSQILILAGTSGGTSAGGGLFLQGGQSGGTGDGGKITILGGQTNSGTAAGDVEIKGGEAAGGSGVGGTVTVQGGESDNGNGGPVFIRGGVAGLNDSGGAISIIAANSNGSNPGAAVNITAGNGGSSGGEGGDVVITAGSSAGGFSDNGGALRFNSAPAGSTNGDGGGLFFTSAIGGSSQGQSGGIEFLIPTAANGNARDFKFTGGQSTTNGRGSDFTVSAGNSVAGDGGDIIFNPGNGQGLGDHGHTLLNKIVAKQVFSGGTFTTSQFINPANGSYQHFTIGAAATLTLTPAAVRTGVFVEMVVEITNGGNAGATVTWSSSVDWAGGSPPTLTAAGIDILRFVTRDGGTNWRGYVLGLDFS